jgi:hypothetical protein
MKPPACHDPCRQQFNPLNAELNPICMSQIAEIFCGAFKFCACFSKNLNISKTKRDNKEHFVEKETDIAQCALNMLIA